MRKVTVPVDMTSEQKTILGIVSTRQLIYCLVCGALIYIVAPFGWKVGIMLSGYIGGIITTVLLAFPFAVIFLPLGFWRREKYHMFLDQYLLTKFRYKDEIGVWRKGQEPKQWMSQFRILTRRK
ncbi:PrgI family protein [Fictibacillus sp. KIGAM418]|uniref:PrgI family protein n=1 Tax=Fictibacillus marinisediminis TaxID=2878389 RepID=A0A9X2BHR0_9BACL|nr:PrgI family protein [Fictibacillus marinisediminis]MCK6259527.1 PrgI family protein [Fictibacillus marinisediminis]